MTRNKSIKKLMLLGGLRYIIPVIKKAKKMGCYVITCDYLPDNIAHKYADEYHNVSIVDKIAVLNLARKLEIDGIMSFAVDPGVITAAYVCEHLGLPSPGPYESIKILQNKGLFRNFLKQNNFNVPRSKTYTNVEFAIEEFNTEDLPVIVKPVDSAGSKGVTKVDHQSHLKKAINHALENSPTKTFIIEEFLEKKGHSSDSDCFSHNGKFKFISFSNQYFDEYSPNPYTPSAYSWPSQLSEKNKTHIQNELQRLIKLLKLKTSIYNIEVRENNENIGYIMEVSPRGGGNRLSEMLFYATGTDLISCAIKAALGVEMNDIQAPTFNGHWAEIILYSNYSGLFQELKIDPVLDKYIVEIDLWVKKGENVNSFNGANDAIGTLVLKFQIEHELRQVIDNYTKYIKIKLK